MRMIYGVLLTLLLSACASVPAPRYFSLQPEQSLAPDEATASAKAILVQAVNVPAQLDKPQIVLTRTTGQEVQVLNDYQWASPLADEIQQALSAGLSQRLGVPSAELSRPEDKVEYWRIDVDVQRFDSVFDHNVRHDLSWRLSPVNFTGPATQLCRISLQSDADLGVEGLVAAHQQLQNQFIDIMVQQMRGAGSIKSTHDVKAISCLN